LKELLNLMKSSGAILEGHFQLTSGRHSDVYLEKFRLLENPEIVEKLGVMMADQFNDEAVDVVLGAAIGGILLSTATAKVIGTKGIFAERVNGKLQLRRGFQINSNDRVLIVEDIITTGGSVIESVEVVKQYRAVPVGVVCLVDRSQTRADFGCPTKMLLRYPAISWEPDECPLCRKGISIESRGRSGKR